MGLCCALGCLADPGLVVSGLASLNRSNCQTFAVLINANGERGVRRNSQESQDWLINNEPKAVSDRLKGFTMARSPQRTTSPGYSMSYKEVYTSVYHSRQGVIARFTKNVSLARRNRATNSARISSKSSYETGGKKGRPEGKRDVTNIDRIRGEGTSRRCT